MRVWEAEPRLWSGGANRSQLGLGTHLLAGLLDGLHLEHLVRGPLLVVDAVLRHRGGPGGGIVGGWDLHLWGPASAGCPGLRGSQRMQSAAARVVSRVVEKPAAGLGVCDPQRLPSLFLLRAGNCLGCGSAARSPGPAPG